MLWLTLALIGYAALAVVFVLDKLILTNTLSKPVVYTFYSTIFMFGALLAWPFGVELLVGIDWVWALISGTTFGFGLWAMFIAVKHGEASHINPFIGAIITIVTFALAAVFLGETLSPIQLLGMVTLALATLLLAFFNEKGFVAFDRSFLWGILAAILFAVSHTTAKYLYELYPFLTGFVWTRATTGFVGLVALCSPAVWRTLRRPSPRQGQAARKKRAMSILIVSVTKVLSVVGVVLIQLAIALGSVTIVNALVGIQYAIMYVLIYLFTILAPRVFRETFSRREVLVEVSAIVFVIIGSALFVLKECGVLTC